MDQSLESMAIIDIFDSAIWTDRYFNYGDFELCVSPTAINVSMLQKDFYLWYEESDHTMIVETRKIITDVDNGNRLIVTGKSLESILMRRIIWGQRILTGNLQNGIEALLNENLIDPVDETRKIYNFVFEASTDPIITVLEAEAQYNGENLYDAIQKLCRSASIGFKVTLSPSGMFVFKLYAGADRSYDQLVNPYVVFSPSFDNLLGSNYIESKEPLKTVTLVAGEGEGINRKQLEVACPDGQGSGLSRREMFTDASGVSSTVDGGTLTEAEYNNQLTQKGSEDLSQNVAIISFEGQVDATRMYKYGEDFFMGDIVQIANEYDMETKVQIVEVVRSHNQSGTDVYPTFLAVP